MHRQARLKALVLALVRVVGGMVECKAMVVVGEVLVYPQLEATLMVPRMGQWAGPSRFQAGECSPPPTVTPAEGVLFSLLAIGHPRARDTLHRPPRPCAVHGGTPACPPCPLLAGLHLQKWVWRRRSLNTFVPQQSKESFYPPRPDPLRCTQPFAPKLIFERSRTSRHIQSSNMDSK